MRILLISLLIFPCASFAQVYGFNSLADFGKIKPQSQIEVTNIPPNVTQDSLGVCYSCVASIMLTAENCRTMKTDCQKVAPEDTFSVVGMAPYGRGDDSEKKQPTGPTKEKKNDRSDGLPGGSVVDLLKYMKYGYAPSEKCISLDQILSKIGGAQEPTNSQIDIWVMLKEMYYNSKKIEPNCPTCQNEFYTRAKDEIEANFNLKLSNEAMLKAFSQETYSRFFDKLFVRSECNKLANGVVFEGQKLELDYLSKEPKRSNYTESIKKVKEVLGKGHTLGLTNICLDKKSSKADTCAMQHAVVVSGYRQVCNAKGVCKDSIKVINCWGKKWQEQNDGGWVDAKELIDRTSYQIGSLSWFNDK
ncbi:hypothetical protein ACLVWU_12275 [Bdellovibrio sp. HCB290]|uniref:hypothetical protein n=1 Tax=Bdellovibrio sp. HCB290 TaxID=3394356 RepID=UPI0039B682EF